MESLKNLGEMRKTCGGTESVNAILKDDLLSPNSLITRFTEIKETINAIKLETDQTKLKELKETLNDQIETLKNLAMIRKDYGGTPSLNEMLRVQTGENMNSLASSFVDNFMEIDNSALSTLGHTFKVPVSIIDGNFRDLQEFANDPRIAEGRKAMEAAINSTEFQSLSENTKKTITESFNAFNDYAKASSAFNSVLKDATRPPRDADKFAKAFDSLEYKNYCKACVKCILVSEEMSELMKKKETTNFQSKFNNEINNIESGLKLNSLGAYLIIPVQKLPRIGLYFGTLYNIKDEPPSEEQVAINKNVQWSNETKRLFEQFD
jgi:hypothetical protein